MIRTAPMRLFQSFSFIIVSMWKKVIAICVRA
jgi:hypothetical protein